MKDKEKKKVSIKKNIFLLFLIYVLIVCIYWLVYLEIYRNDQSSFIFNSEIKTAKVYEVMTPILKDWKGVIIDKEKQELIDTTKEGNKWTIRKHRFVYQFIVNRDTFLFKDTNQINKSYQGISASYERNRIIPIWHELDFLYFSFITISTVGYGDILPNSTTVRMVVTSEVFLGQFILVFSLALILTELPRRQNKERPKD